MSDQIVCASEQTESGLATFTQRQNFKLHF